MSFSYKIQKYLILEKKIAPITVTETIHRDKASTPTENYITYNYQGGLAYISLDINQKTKKSRIPKF